MKKDKFDIYLSFESVFHIIYTYIGIFIYIWIETYKVALN